LAITLPNPVELPVTSATLPFNENNSSLMGAAEYGAVMGGASFSFYLYRIERVQ
jgi:hypothetical protein